jgi:hypothetical protein
MVFLKYAVLDSQNISGTAKGNSCFFAGCLFIKHTVYGSLKTRPYFES